MSISLLISCAGLIGASINPTTTSVVILQGFISGFGGGAAYIPAILWLPQWFDEKRGLATGVIFLGSGLGGYIWPFVISALLNKTGFNWTLRCLCLIQLVVGGIIVSIMRPRLSALPPNASTRPRRSGLLRRIMPTHNTGLNSRLGFTTITLQFLNAASFKTIAYYIAPYASSLGLSSLIFTTVLAALNAASAVSYVMTGKLCDVLPHGIIMLLVNAISTVLVGALFGLASTFASLLVFAITYGLVNRGLSTTISPMARQIAKRSSSDSSPIFLEYLAVRGLGGLCGPLISATLYKPTSKTLWSAKAIYGSHGIGPVVIFTTVMSGIVAFLSIFIVNFRSIRTVAS